MLVSLLFCGEFDFNGTIGFFREVEASRDGIQKVVCLNASLWALVTRPFFYYDLSPILLDWNLFCS